MQPGSPDPGTHQDGRGGAGTGGDSQTQAGSVHLGGWRAPLAGWRAAAASVADQGVTSLTNILVLVLVARAASTERFGTFSLVAMVAAVLVGAGAAFLAQPLVLRPAGSLAAGVRAALRLVATVSAGLGALLVLVAVWFPGEIARAFVALGLVLPVVAVQDLSRYCFAALRRAHLALLSDLAWLGAVVPALLALPAGAQPAAAIAVWGLTAVPALALAALGLRALLRDGAAERTPTAADGAVVLEGTGGDTARSLLARGYLGRRFLVEYAAGNASGQLSVIGLGAVTTPVAVAALRGSSTLFGPVNVLLGAVAGFAPPHLVRLVGARRRSRAALLLAGGLLAVTAVWSGVLLLLPDDVGAELLGESWALARTVAPAMACQYLAMSWGTAGALALRVLQPRATLPIQVPFSLLNVVLLVLGYVVGGVVGAAWGLVVGSGLKALVTWWRVRVLVRAA